MIQLRSANELAVMHGVKCLVFGRAGMGKTSLVATAPNPVLISSESGVLSLRKDNLERMFGVNNPSICYNIPVIEIKTIQDLQEAYQWASSSMEAQQFQTIGLDSISDIAETVLANAKGQVKDPRQAYGELLDKMMMTIKAFRDIKGPNVYMSAKAEKNKDEMTGAVMVTPSMPGTKLAQQIPYLFDEMFYLDIGRNPDNSTYRYLRTQPDFTVDAKDRSGALAPLEMPHLGAVFAKIQGCAA